MFLLPELLAGVATSRLHLDVTDFSVGYVSAAKHVFDGSPHFT